MIQKAQSTEGLERSSSPCRKARTEYSDCISLLLGNQLLLNLNHECTNL